MLKALGIEKKRLLAKEQTVSPEPAGRHVLHRLRTKVIKKGEKGT